MRKLWNRLLGRKEQLDWRTGWPTYEETLKRATDMLWDAIEIEWNEIFIEVLTGMTVEVLDSIGPEEYKGEYPIVD